LLTTVADGAGAGAEADADAFFGQGYFYSSRIDSCKERGSVGRIGLTGGVDLVDLIGFVTALTWANEVGPREIGFPRSNPAISRPSTRNLAGEFPSIDYVGPYSKRLPSGIQASRH
jgi:hypothetical protein